MSFDHQPVRKAGRSLLAVVVGLGLVTTSSAQASGTAIWQECAQTGTVSTNHSQKDYSDALSNPPADGAEYSPCTDLIRAAQNKAASGGGGKSGTPSGGAVGGTNSGGGTGSGSSSPAVDAGALQKALTKSGVNPAAPPSAGAPAPAPALVDGKRIDLTSDRVPSIAGALSLPLPLAASAVVVLLSAAMPVARYLVARFGGPPTGTSPAD